MSAPRIFASSLTGSLLGRYWESLKPNSIQPVDEWVVFLISFVSSSCSPNTFFIQNDSRLHQDQIPRKAVGTI